MKSVKSTLYFHLQKIFTAAGSDSVDKSHLRIHYSAWKMGIANIYILEKGTMVHHFVCGGHKILNFEKNGRFTDPVSCKNEFKFC